MNNPKLTLLLIACLLSLSLPAQTTKEAFVSLPESLSVDLDAHSRTDLIDLYHAGQPALVANSFGDTLVLEQLTPEYLRLATGKGSLQLIVLKMINESPLYCLIHTVCGPVCDSRIEFYSPSWNRLSTENFITQASIDFFIADRSDFPSLNIVLMQWAYDPETATLQQIYNTPDYVNSDDRKNIQPYIKTRVKNYYWTGMRFTGSVDTGIGTD
jgi:hypothetical protein